MPEGPEIRRAADRIGRAIEGKKAVEVYFGLPSLEERGSELSGRIVRRVRARGKAVVVTFSGDRHVYSHNQLYGRWFVRGPRDFPRTRRNLRFAVHTRSASALLYSASEIEVLERRELRTHPYLSRLGPDPLESSTTAGEIAARALEAGFRRRSFGALLLDQGFIAGIGNYLRSEILYFSRLHPRRRPTDTSPEGLAHLGRFALELSRRSYATAGITNDPEWSAELKRAGEPRRRYRHAVFGQEGSPCPRCGRPIEKRLIGGRRLYLCPGCQPR
jgi:endonuclease-8